MAHRSRRKRATAVAPPRSAGAHEANPPQPGAKEATSKLNTWLALITASGVLATIVGFALDRYYDRIITTITGPGEEAALSVHVDDGGGFAALEGTVWALLGSLPESEPTDAVIRSAGAVAIGQTVVAVTVENQGTEPLTMISFKAVRHTRDPMIAGTLLHVAPGGGGGLPPPINLGFALDTSDLEARVVENSEFTAAHYLNREGVALKPGEQMRLRLAGFSTTHRVGWSAVLRYVVDGKENLAYVGSEKEQFHVTGASQHYARAYEWAASSVRTVSQADICGLDCRTSLRRGQR